MPVRGSKPQTLQGLLWATIDSWATRSLAVGAAATLLDIGVGLACLHGLLLPTRAAAMAGVAVGAAFTFLANRTFAFRDKDPNFAKPALKFLVATAVGMVFHAQLVVLMRDQAGIPFVVAKMVADVGVFTFGQLLVFRYLVFPEAAASGETAGAPAVQRQARDLGRALGAGS